jgi:hypothetical protein
VQAVTAVSAASVLKRFEAQFDSAGPVRKRDWLDVNVAESVSRDVPSERGHRGRDWLERVHLTARADGTSGDQRERTDVCTHVDDPVAWSAMARDEGELTGLVGAAEELSLDVVV